jgi:hypothetical protein
MAAFRSLTKDAARSREAVHGIGDRIKYVANGLDVRQSVATRFPPQSHQQIETATQPCQCSVLRILQSSSRWSYALRSGFLQRDAFPDPRQRKIVEVVDRHVQPASADSPREERRMALPPRVKVTERAGQLRLADGVAPWTISIRAC